MRMLRLFAEVALLGAVYVCGEAIVRWTRLPLPGSVVGMGVMLLLLVTGVVPVRWVENAAGLLLKGFTLLFLPDLIGLRGVWPAVRSHAVPLLAVAVLSTVMVLLASAAATVLVGRCARHVAG